jgi:hypothetical protein
MRFSKRDPSGFGVILKTQRAFIQKARHVLASSSAVRHATALGHSTGISSKNVVYKIIIREPSQKARTLFIREKFAMERNVLFKRICAGAQSKNLPPEASRRRIDSLRIKCLTPLTSDSIRAAFPSNSVHPGICVCGGKCPLEKAESWRERRPTARPAFTGTKWRISNGSSQRWRSRRSYTRTSLM